MSTEYPASAAIPDAPDAGTAREVRKLVIFSAGLLFVLFGIVGVWAALAGLYGAVVAQGVLKVEANLKLAQHADGGVVRRILVKEGQHVAQGEPIVELENVEADASLSIVRDQLDAEIVKQARLTAEIKDSNRLEIPADLRKRTDSPNVRSLVQNEETLFSARRRVLIEQSNKMLDQKKAIQAEIASLARQIGAAEKSLSYLYEQEKMNELLFAQNFVANTRLLDAKRSTAEKEEKKHEFESLRAQAQQRLADIELRRDALYSTRLNESSRDLVESQSKILNLRERLRPAQEVLERRLIRSPATGTIHVLRAHTQGGVVAPRETVAEIVPDLANLVAEVNVNPADIDEVRTGQEVELELSGLNRRSTPLLKGKLTFVSPDLNTEQTNPAIKFFVVRVGIDRPIPNSVTISPGMPVAAYIRTRMRSPLELWLDPLIGAIRKSWRET